MTYLPTAEHDELRAVVRELAEERIAPRAAEIDEKRSFPTTSRTSWPSRTCSARASRSVTAGRTLTRSPRRILVEEIARADATTSLIPIVQKLGALPILLAGSDEQKDRYFPRLASGEWLVAFALTEAAAGWMWPRTGCAPRATVTSTSSTGRSDSSPTARWRTS